MLESSLMISSAVVPCSGMCMLLLISTCMKVPGIQLGICFLWCIWHMTAQFTPVIHGRSSFFLWHV